MSIPPSPPSPPPPSLAEIYNPPPLSDDVLSIYNAHPRDAFLEFDEAAHKYTITSDLSNNYTSVTTVNKRYFEEFNSQKIATGLVKKHTSPSMTYYGMTVKEITDKWKKTGTAAAKLGTELHADIEHFMNDSVLNKNYTHADLYDRYEILNQPQSIEWLYFIKFIGDTPDMIPYRTEWMIYDETIKIAGAVDMVYKNTDGVTYSIYDWKRCKPIIKYSSYGKRSIHRDMGYIHDTNYWHYALQLNTYKMILERNYGIQITDLVLIRMHDDGYEENGTYEKINLPIMEDEMKKLYL